MKCPICNSKAKESNAFANDGNTTVFKCKKIKKHHDGLKIRFWYIDDDVNSDVLVVKFQRNKLCYHKAICIHKDECWVIFFTANKKYKISLTQMSTIEKFNILYKYMQDENKLKTIVNFQ